VDTSDVLSGKFELLSLPDLYDLLAEETVRFNRLLLQKASKEETSSLKNEIKKIQEEIYRRKEIH
jgi:hypothetical protein